MLMTDLQSRAADQKAAWRAGVHPEAPAIEAAERFAPGALGCPDARMLVYAPKAAQAPLPAILHIHGGGYVAGNPESYDLANRKLARDLDCLIVSVDYRLAPGARFPFALEDCYAALKWLRDNAGELGVDASRIAIMGEGAGGGLGAALALLARQRAEVAVAFQMLLYPMIDDRAPAEPPPCASEIVWTRENSNFGWASLLGHEPGVEEVSCYAAAARAEDLSDLPPTYLATGSLDLVLEADLDYARRLTRAGVATELHVYPGAYPGFQIAGDSSIGRRFERDYRAALIEALKPREAGPADPYPADRNQPQALAATA